MKKLLIISLVLFSLVSKGQMSRAIPNVNNNALFSNPIGRYIEGQWVEGKTNDTLFLKNEVTVLRDLLEIEREEHKDAVIRLVEIIRELKDLNYLLYAELKMQEMKLLDCKAYDKKK